MEKRHHWFACAVVLLLSAVTGASPAWAQADAPEFDVDVINVRGDASPLLTRVDLYTRIPYAELQFINTVDGFTARYDVSVEAHALDDKGRRANLLQTRLWEGKVVVPTYVATQAREYYDFTTQSLDLPLGRYVFEFEIRDRQTNQAFVREKTADVRDLSGTLAVSDLMIAEAFDAATNAITPSVSNQVGTDNLAFKLFYEVYANTPRNVLVTREVVRAVQVGPSIVAIPTPEDGSLPVALYEETSEATLEGKRTQFIDTIPLTDLGMGTFIMRVKVADADGTIHTIDRPFSTRWTGLAAHLSDVEEAIAQLRIVAKDKDIRYIRDGRSEAERLNRFLDYWKKRDPTPDTRRNERMEEYYYRIAFANEKYSRQSGKDPGWQTDRGFVLVRFGEPDYIERQPFSFNSQAWEVWNYERLGLQFIFIDRTGLGDYELLHPIWDERNRIR